MAKETYTEWVCDSCATTTKVAHNLKPAGWHGLFLTPESSPDHDVNDRAMTQFHICASCFNSITAVTSGRYKVILKVLKNLIEIPPKAGNAED
jgi:hypothetical protein